MQAMLNMMFGFQYVVNYFFWVLCEQGIATGEKFSNSSARKHSILNAIDLWVPKLENIRVLFFFFFTFLYNVKVV